MRSSNVIGYIVLILLAIGIIVTLKDNPLIIIIPVVLFGLIFTLLSDHRLSSAKERSHAAPIAVQ